MRFLFLAEADSANSGSLLAQSLTKQGHEVKAYCAGEHPFGYPNQMEYPVPKDDLIELVKWADSVTLIQSMMPKCLWDDPIRWLAILSSKPLVMTHGGSHYRAAPELFVAQYAHSVAATICYEADLMGHFPNEHLVLPPVDLQFFTPRLRWGPMRVGHFPSNPDNKGTFQIVPKLGKYDHRVSTYRVDWDRQMDRVKDCDVIVDQIEPRIGEWVTLATEVAALGCVSIANSHNPKPYVETYGRSPGIHICNTVDEMETELDRLNGLTRTELNAEKRESRAWIEQCHTLEATGKILMDKVYGPIL